MLKSKIRSISSCALPSCEKKKSPKERNFCLIFICSAPAVVKVIRKQIALAVEQKNESTHEDVSFARIIHFRIKKSTKTREMFKQRKKEEGKKIVLHNNTKDNRYEQFFSFSLVLCTF